MNQAVQVLDLLGPNGERWAKGTNWEQLDDGPVGHCMFGALGAVNGLDMHPTISSGGSYDDGAADLTLGFEGARTRAVFTRVAFRLFGNEVTNLSYEHSRGLTNTVQTWQDRITTPWWKIRAVLLVARDELERMAS